MPEMPKDIVSTLFETPIPANDWQAKAENDFNQKGYFQFLHAVYYTVIFIFLIGLGSLWGITFVSPDPMLGLLPMTIIFVLGSLYFWILARSSTQLISFDPDHLYLGKNPQDLHAESEYQQMYYVSSLVRWSYGILLSKWRREYTVMVFRKKPCFPPLAFLLDMLLPASNSNRQVIILLTGWKDYSGTLVPDQGVAKQIIKYCERYNISIKKWYLEAEILLLLIIGIGGYLLLSR